MKTSNKFDFGYRTPALTYDFSEIIASQIFSQWKNLINNKHIDDINILLWLWFGISDSDFEYLCAYFLEREFGYSTVITEWYNDDWIDINGIRNFNRNTEYISMQCKKRNSDVTNSSWAFENYNLTSKNENKHFLATIDSLNEWIWDSINDNFEIWDSNSIVEYYNKYFSDPDAGWHDFKLFKEKKKQEKKNINRIENETQILTETKTRDSINIRSGTVKELYELKEVYESLIKARKKLATKYRITPNYVCTNKVLLEMAKKRPQSKLDFLKIQWIWETKYKKYWEEFSAVLSNYQR